MSGLAESAAAINLLCDAHAAKFERSVYGQFDGRVIANDVLSLRSQGLIRMKTQAEIDADSAAIEASQLGHKRKSASARHFVGRGGYPANRWAEVIAGVDRVMRESGVNLTTACDMEGTTVRSYRKWAAKLKKKGG